MTNIDKLVAVEKQQGVSLDFLGYLIWFSVADCRITWHTLETIFDAVGLNEKFLPKAINPRDAFRRATSAAEIKKEPYGEETFLNLMVRDVQADKDRIERQLVREVVDSKNTRLEHKPVARIILNDDQLAVIPMEDMNYQERAAIERIESSVEYEKEHYNGRTCRDIINDVLSKCLPVAMRNSGGVYFVPRQFELTVETLQNFCKQITAYSVTSYKSKLDRVPVVDASEQKEMLEENVEEQVKKNSESLVNEMTKIIKNNKKVTEKMALGYIKQAKELRELVESYREMLQAEIAGADASLELVNAQALEMLDRAEE